MSQEEAVEVQSIDALPDAAPAGLTATGTSNRTQILPQMVRYLVVSGLALCLDFAVFYATLRLGVPAPAAGVVGYCVGLVLHYCLSCFFVFDAAATKKDSTRLFTEFVASGLVGVLSTWIIIFSVEQFLGLSPLIAKGVAVIVTFVLVFGIRRSIVFAAYRP